MEDDKQFLKKCIELATDSAKSGGGPFGALIVKDGEIIGKGVNSVTKTNDPTAHGEIVAIRDAAKNISDFSLSGSTIYTNAEPCSMCMSAIYWSRIARVVYSTPKEETSQSGFDDSKIYKQICTPDNNTPGIDITHIPLPENKEPFSVWDKNQEKIGY